MNKLKLFYQELRSLYQFFKKVNPEDKKIVFYAEHQGYYPYFEGMIRELTNEHKQNLCYVTSDPTDPILQETNPQIKTFYLNKLLIPFMTSVDSNVFVMTLTDLNNFHLKRSLKPVHYVYAFHALVSTNMMYLNGAFDHYDSVLCIGPHQIEEIRKREEMKELKRKELVEAGYYRLERIYEAYQKYKELENAEHTGESEKTKTLLIAPSWGKDNVLESCGEELVRILLGEGYKVIVRPHPETVRRSPELLASLETNFSDNPRFLLEKSIATDDSFLKADVLISDCSGVALEYAFGTERPVLFLDVPPKVKNEQFKELGIEPLELFLRPRIGVVVSPDNLNRIPEEISQLIANKEKYQKEIIELRKQKVSHFGESSKIGALHIMDIISK